MVRQSRQYEELRYALRSIAANLPHGKVWVYGGEPRWLTGAAHVPVRQGAHTHTNTARITAAIAGNRALSSEFYWFHDDMFVLDPIETIPRVWRCPWDDWRATARERRDPHGPAKTFETEATLAAFGRTPLYSYELHIPMAVERDVLREMVAAVTAWRPEALALVQKRSLYGNWTSYGGQRADDVKFHRATAGALGTFASSSDDALRGGMGEELCARFPGRSRYERAHSGETSAARLMAGHLGARHDHVG
jgi:hypothetical protein